MSNPSIPLSAEQVRKVVGKEATARLTAELKAFQTYYSTGEVDILNRTDLVNDVIKLRMMVGIAGEAVKTIVTGFTPADTSSLTPATPDPDEPKRVGLSVETASTHKDQFLKLQRCSEIRFQINFGAGDVEADSGAPLSVVHENMLPPDCPVSNTMVTLEAAFGERVQARLQLSVWSAVSCLISPLCVQCVGLR